LRKTDPRSSSFGPTQKPSIVSTHGSLLFLYMVPETGHQKAAEAIIASASHMDPRVESVGVDAGRNTYPWIGSVINRMYLQMLKRAPFIWEYLYDNPDVEEATRDARGLLTFLTSFRMKRLIRRYRPVAVVCTQAAPATAVAAEKRRGHLPVPLVCVVTDFGVHQYWIHPEVDLYLVAHEDVKQEMVRRGIEEDRIRVTGIPIDPKFGETMDQLEARRRLRLNPSRQTILLMGGSQGLGSLDELAESLKTLPMDVQIIAIAGRNRSLYRKLVDVGAGESDFHVFGYVKDLAPVMSAADILITKPGGLTCSEALARQLPLVLTNPIPGQEERNVRFLTTHQAARIVRSQEDLLHTVSDLLRHPKKLTAMRQRAKLISKPFSSWEAARLIFDLVNKRGPFAPRRTSGPLPR